MKSVHPEPFLIHPNTQRVLKLCLQQSDRRPERRHLQRVCDLLARPLIAVSLIPELAWHTAVAAGHSVLAGELDRVAKPRERLASPVAAARTKQARFSDKQQRKSRKERRPATSRQIEEDTTDRHRHKYTQRHTDRDEQINRNSGSHRPVQARQRTHPETLPEHDLRAPISLSNQSRW